MPSGRVLGLEAISRPIVLNRAVQDRGLGPTQGCVAREESDESNDCNSFTYNELLGLFECFY